MIFIKEIDQNNVFDICELTTNSDGIGTTMEKYLCCNATSLAESKYDLDMYPNAIYNDNVLIGFFMYKRLKSSFDIATICRFMIDYKYQNKGLGRKAFEEILKHLKDNDVKKAIIMIDETNEIAKKLYLSFGFTFTGKIQKEEYYYQLTL